MNDSVIIQPHCLNELFFCVDNFLSLSEKTITSSVVHNFYLSAYAHKLVNLAIYPPNNVRGLTRPPVSRT